MSCDRAGQVQAWYDDELQPPQRQELEQHLAVCSECAQLAAQLRQLSQMLSAAPRASMGADVKRRLEQAWWRARDRGVLRLAEWLTAAAAAILIGGLIFISNEDRSTQTSMHASAWAADAMMPPPETRDEPASDVVVLAEWMANDLSTEANR